MCFQPARSVPAASPLPPQGPWPPSTAEGNGPHPVPSLLAASGTATPPSPATCSSSPLQGRGHPSPPTSPPGPPPNSVSTSWAWKPHKGCGQATVWKCNQPSGHPPPPQATEVLGSVYRPGAGALEGGRLRHHLHEEEAALPVLDCQAPGSPLWSAGRLTCNR